MKREIEPHLNPEKNTRPPKDKKPVEYTLTVVHGTDEETGADSTRFEVRTTREFQSFQYVLNVDGTYDPEAKKITIRIRGVSLPPDLMPSQGAAVGAFVIPSIKSGLYSLIVKKAPKDENVFSVKVTKTSVRVEPESAASKKFVELV